MVSKSTLVGILILISALLICASVAAIVLGARLSVQKDTETPIDSEKTKAKSKWSEYAVLAVATDNEICSTIGRDVLTYRGGSTVDAAIAAMLCLGMVNPQHSGIGGGFNAIIYDRSKNDSVQKAISALNARETVPASVDINYYDNNPSSAAKGPLTTLIPGEINGYHEAWKKYGRVSWKDLFQPTIQLGREGWRVTQSMDASIRSAINDIRADPGLSELLLKPDGMPYEAGDTIRNRKLAETLERIANDGPETFYSGTIARDLLLDLRDIGVQNITADDLQSNRATFNQPLKASLPWSGLDLYTTPPASSGVLTAFVLKIMDGYRYSPDQLRDQESVVLFYHRLIEAWKIAFSESEYLGDIGYNTSVEEWSKNMVDDQYVDRWRAFIKDDRVLDPSSLISTRNDKGSTSGVLVLTADGAGVSATTTVGSLWGCKKRGNRTGVVFNDGMSLFNVRASTNVTSNYIAPLKHGRSSTSPVMLFDNTTQRLRLMHSGAGSQRIVTSISFIASQILWRDLSPVEATDEPRVHHQGAPNRVVYDDVISQVIVDGLAKKGHSLLSLSSSAYPYLGVTQTVQSLGCPACSQRVNLTAVSDYRKGVDSAPSGF